MDPKRHAQAVGARAGWGRVGYAGDAYAPVPGTYLGVDPLRRGFGTVADSGPGLDSRGALANLFPLVVAALYEAGFAAEAGPLSTWNN